MIGEFKQDVQVNLPGANPLGAPLIAYTLQQIHQAEWEIAKSERSHICGCMADSSDYDYAPPFKEPMPSTIYVRKQIMKLSQVELDILKFLYDHDAEYPSSDGYSVDAMWGYVGNYSTNELQDALNSLHDRDFVDDTWEDLDWDNYVIYWAITEKGKKFIKGNIP